MTAMIWYVRHGESESNVRGVFAGGQDDTPLTDNGREQAHHAGKKLKDLGIRFDQVIASPLSRTRETAQIIAAELRFEKTKIMIDDRFREYDVGSGNGISYEGATSQLLTSFPGAENPNAFENRVRRALKDAIKLSGTILIVAHGGVGKLIHCMQAGGDPKDFYDYPKYPNAEPVKLKIDWLI